jgi:hypothetical protein
VVLLNHLSINNQHNLQVKVLDSKIMTKKKKISSQVIRNIDRLVVARNHHHYMKRVHNNMMMERMMKTQRMKMRKKMIK